MNDIYSLLNINSEVIRDYHLLASRVADHQTEKVINSNVNMLKHIEERMFIDSGIEIPKRSIDDVIRKVIRLSAENDNSPQKWTIRELRIVSYYLMKLRNNAKDYHFALSLLDNNWRNLYFNGLVFYLMNTWNSIEIEFRDATCKLVTKKLREYKDSNKRYKLLRNHTDLFEKSGPIRMAAIISAKRMNLTNAPSIIGFKNSAFKQSYFSDVILKYIDSNNIDNLDYIEELLEVHDLDRTKKLLFANLVEKANNKGDGVSRAVLCRFINRMLGDVTMVSTWAPFAGASLAEAERLKEAMKLVNLWFTQQIIEVFFKVCVQDKERKKFWLKYVDNISGFKIVGSTTTKRLLQNDSKIGGMFYKHFIETNQYTSQTSALVLFIKNKMIVEFSDTGALYVYNQDNKQVKLVTSHRRNISSTNDLKITSMQILIEISELGRWYFEEEGRMTHQGNWQSRLSAWMDRMVLSKSNTHVSFFDIKDDEVFKETPLKKEEEVSFDEPDEEENKTDSNKNTPPLRQLFNDADELKNKVKFRKNITIKLLSKSVNNIRIVANESAFYINKIANSEYVMIKEFIPGEKPIGSIWIKQPNYSDWSEIVHFYNGAEICIGYIKLLSDRVLYKQTLAQQDIKQIEFM